MKPAIDLSGRQGHIDTQTLIDLLNRDAFRSRSIVTRLHDATPRTYDAHYFASTTLDDGSFNFDAWRTAGRANCLAPGTVAYTLNRLIGIPFVVSAPFPITKLQFEVTTGGAAGSVARIGVYGSIGDRIGRPYPGALLYGSDSFDTTSTGLKTVSDISIPLLPGHLYWMAYLAGVAAPTIRTVPRAGMYPMPGVEAAVNSDGFWGLYASFAFAALPSEFPKYTDVFAETGAQAPALSFHQGADGGYENISYLHVARPIDAGTVIRAANLLPSTDLEVQRIGPSLRVGLGLRSAGAFDLLGEEWNSARAGLSIETPFALMRQETRIPSGSSVPVRMVQTGWPAVALPDASVETTLGYEGGV